MPVSFFILKYVLHYKYWLPVLIPPSYNIRNTFNFVVSTKKTQQKQRNILNNSEPNAGLPTKKGKRQNNAKDAQDILPSKAPLGKETTGHQKRKRKRGRPRKVQVSNPFGKYPTSSALSKYLLETKQYYAPSTNEERTRKSKYICKTMTVVLKAPPSPRNVKEEHIRAFMAWMEQKGLGNATQRRYLRDYLAYYGNDVVSKMLGRRQIRIPSDIPPEIRSLSAETVRLIHEMSKSMEGWEGVMLRFITLAYPYTGLRPSELRTMKFEDVNLESWTLTVSHPKGENKYGKKRRIGILPILKPVFKTFLMERKLFLEEHGETETFEALIPYNGRYGLDYWSMQELNKTKQKIQKLSGINFKIKDYRATFCQLAIDKGADLQAVSKMMGHNTTVTTETYYGRIQDDTAIQEIERAFTEPMLEINKTAQ